MTTLFCNRAGIIFKWDENLHPDENNKNVNIGDYLTFEYKRIKIVSSKFDFFGKSKIMIVNYVKSVQTKEQTLQSITYYDTNAKPKGSKLNKYRSYAIGPFDPSDYGNPVCFFTPGYQGEVITLTTQFWEIDDADALQNTSSGIQSCISLGESSVNPYSIYFQIADEAVGVSSKILTSFIKHDKLSEDHVTEFRIDEGVPMLTGLYIGLPGVDDMNERNKILSEYHIEDFQLLKNIVCPDGTKKLVEYNSTYFILMISTRPRTDLIDFNYAASSSDLMNKLNNEPESFISSLTSVTKDAYDMNIISQISSILSSDSTDSKNIVKALFQHLSTAKQEIVKKLFPNITV